MPSPTIEHDAVQRRWIRGLDRLRNHLFARDVAPLRQPLLAFCRRLTRNRADADDLMQETLARSHGVFCDMCGGPLNAKAYLFKIATNCWIDHLRKRQREAGCRKDLSAAVWASPVCFAELAMQLSQTLTRRELEAFLLCDILRYTGAEAARMLGTSAAAVKMAASRARKRAREAIAL